MSAQIRTTTTVTGAGPNNIRAFAVRHEPARTNIGAVHVQVGNDLDVYLTAAGATALRDTLTDVLATLEQEASR